MAEAWDWHVWHRDPKTNVRKYCGFFASDKDALEWKKRQTNPDQYRVTNQGPLGIAKASGVVTKTERVRPSQAVEAMAAARREADRRNRESIAARDKRVKVSAEQKARNEKEMAGVRKDAADLIEMHKADEAEDIKKGINR